MIIDNVHERELSVPAAEVGRLLDQLGSAQDVLWPSPTWAPMRFDRPLAVGADGGHGSVRYRVSRYEPGRLVEFSFDPACGLRGTHTLEVVPRGESGSLLRHRVSGRPIGAMKALWPLLVERCHDTVIEHLFDNAERSLTQSAGKPVDYPRRIRLVATMESVRVKSVPIPTAARLLHDWAEPPLDIADAFALTVPAGTSTDPEIWASRIFREPPRPVMALFRLRNALVPLLRIKPNDLSAFDTLARSDHEVLLGIDDSHLHFRASVLVEPGPAGTTITVSTGAKVRSRAGRAYLGAVRLAHPLVVRGMLLHAGHRATAPAS